MNLNLYWRGKFKPRPPRKNCFYADTILDNAIYDQLQLEAFGTYHRVITSEDMDKLDAAAAKWDGTVTYHWEDDVELDEWMDNYSNPSLSATETCTK